MKLAIGKMADISLLEEATGRTWVYLRTNDREAHEIRADIARYRNLDIALVTLHPWALNCVGDGEGLIHYEDVYIVIRGEVLALTTWKTEAWLSHFALGDVIERLGP